MRNYLALLAIPALMFGSCKKCKDCSATSTVYYDGTEGPTTDIAAQEFCGSDLKDLEDNLVQETVSESLNLEIRTVVTYTCVEQ